jgi:hypothetical protein
MTTSAAIRQSLIDTLRTDLVGPGPGHALEAEQLWESEPPSRWYLTGFLVPREAPEEQRFDPESQETLDAPLGDEEGQGDDDTEPDAAPAKKAFLPSSIGVSVLVPEETAELQAEVRWGDYKKVPVTDPAHPDRKVWQRTQRSETVQIALDPTRPLRPPVEVPNGRGLQVYVSTRAIDERTARDLKLPTGTRAVSVFVVNERDPKTEDRADEANVFQVELVLRSPAPFVPRPNVRGLTVDDPDEKIADLQYRDDFEFAVGHGIATVAVLGDGKRCNEVHTAWMPDASVEKVEPAAVKDVELGMEELGRLADGAAAQKALEKLPKLYAEWIKTERSTTLVDPRRAGISSELLDRCALAGERIAKGIALLEDPVVLDAFRISNRAMAKAGRQRLAQIKNTKPALVDAPTWRPFQLAFLLMNLEGLVRPTSSEREIVDLLFFPTGGGKTEAYLGLAAFTLALRRLRDPSAASAGMTVLMRYTLRLLTLDQLGRAAGLMCALELEREQQPERLGEWPFEVGLWVGKKATPNRMGKRGEDDRTTARRRTSAFKNDSKGKPAPIPIENCPWCGTKFTAGSFKLKPNDDHPTDLVTGCVNEDCEFCPGKDGRHLPIVAVDEPLYRRLPCFVIATVDKLASLPWMASPGKLFGKVERYDKNGFYGVGESTAGTKLPHGLPAPDLIIQDELHLISGPLGTMVGLYETAIDALCERTVDGKTVRPKVVASTATVRRADAQVRALFARARVEVFPPPGPNRRDSFFAITVDASKKHARMYLGIAAQGRSLKVVLLRTYLTLLSAIQTHYDANGGKVPGNPADPYMTLLGYFNEVRSGAQRHERHRRATETRSTFTNRTIKFDAVELTSRVSTADVADAKRRLALRFDEEKPVDVALATNMISVGLDISRLGLMVVLGQPKMTAEYIQATSRVGRDEERPGLVVTLLNVHKPRDRSHYERFEAYHQTFYRAVEATSVTPFAPRAIDRGLAAITVAMARHGEPTLTPAPSAAHIDKQRSKLDWIAVAMKRRATVHSVSQTATERDELVAKLEQRVNGLLSAWSEIALEANQNQTGLQYGPFEAKPRPPLLRDPLDADLRKEPIGSPRRRFKAQWSLRDVEPEVPVLVRRLDGGDVEGS